MQGDHHNNVMCAIEDLLVYLIFKHGTKGPNGRMRIVLNSEMLDSLGITTETHYGIGGYFEKHPTKPKEMQFIAEVDDKAALMRQHLEENCFENHHHNERGNA